MPNICCTSSSIAGPPVTFPPSRSWWWVGAPTPSIPCAGRGNWGPGPCWTTAPAISWPRTKFCGRNTPGWACRGREFAHPKIIDKELQEYREAEAIVLPSQFSRETFISRGVPAAKLLLAPYGVNLSNFYPVGKPDKTFRVIHCGQISLRKGVHYLLQAFTELQLPGAELWLIGSLTEEFRPLLQRFASASIRHLGPFPEPELHKYYSQGSVFCLNSIEDGFGMVLVQAMACGLPVITTTNTGAADAVREGRDGFIIPIRDVAALKEKLLYFYENPEAGRSMGEAARERVQAGFTWADYGAKIIAGYRRVLGGPGSGEL